MSMLIVLTIGWQCAAGLEEPDEAVQAGRQSLDRWVGSYPWYDAPTDGVRRVRVSAPWDWSWLEWLFGGSGTGWGLSWGTLLIWLARTVIVILAVVLIYYLVRSYRRRLENLLGTQAQAEDARRNDLRRIEALPAPVSTRPTDLLAEARRLYAEGRFGEATIYLFSHQLVELDKRQLIQLEKGKTNRQYLRELGRRPLRQLVEQTMIAFEDVFFGNHRIDRSRFESSWNRLGEFEALSAEGR